MKHAVQCLSMLTVLLSGATAQALSSAEVSFPGVIHPQVTASKTAPYPFCLALSPAQVTDPDGYVSMAQFGALAWIDGVSPIAEVTLADLYLQVDGAPIDTWATCLSDAPLCDTQDIGIGEGKTRLRKNSPNPILTDMRWSVMGDPLTTTFGGKTWVGSTIIKDGYVVELCGTAHPNGYPTTLTFYRPASNNSPADPDGFITTTPSVNHPNPQWDLERVLWVNTSGNCGGQPCLPAQNWDARDLVVDESVSPFGAWGWAWAQSASDTYIEIKFQ